MSAASMGIGTGSAEGIDERRLCVPFRHGQQHCGRERFAHWGFGGSQAIPAPVQQVARAVGAHEAGVVRHADND